MEKSWMMTRATRRLHWAASRRAGRAQRHGSWAAASPLSGTPWLRAALRVGDNARKGAAVRARPTLLGLMGFSRILFAPVTEKEALPPLPKARVNVLS